jgi:predicted nucleotidyltransferase
MEPMPLDPAIQNAIERVSALLKAQGVTVVYLLGSAAAGEMRKASDLDFAVVGLPTEICVRTVADAMGVAGREVDIVNPDRGGDFVGFLRRHGKLRRVA